MKTIISKWLKLLGIFFLLLCVLPITYLLAYELGIFGSEAEWSPRWSPDGSQIAFECAYPRPSDFFDAINNPTFFRDVREICVFDLSTGKYKRLTGNHSVSSPAWSPTGDRLAWISTNSIIVWNVQTNRRTKFQSEYNFEYGSVPSWSQSGETIFVQGDGGKLDLNSGKVSRLNIRSAETHVCCFKWSPDGQYLAYQRVKSEDDANHLRLIIEYMGNVLYESEYDADGSSISSNNMQWSPDLNTLAWVESENWRPVLTYVPTLQTTVINDDPDIFPTDFAWAPSGKRIAIGSIGDNGFQEFYILDLAFSEAQSQYSVVGLDKIITNAQNFGDITWSPDEENVAYESSFALDSVIWIIDLDSKEQFQLIDKKR